MKLAGRSSSYRSGWQRLSTTISITRRGRRVLAVMPWELYESVVETIEVLSDPEMTAALRSSLNDLEKGRLVGHEEARKRLKL